MIRGRSVALGPEEVQQRPHLAQRTTAGLLDGRQRADRLAGLGRPHVAGHPRLHGDHAHRVRHHVVHLAGDLQPLLGADAAGLGQPLTGPLLGLLLPPGQVRALLAHRITDHPRDHDEQRALREKAGRGGRPAGPVDAVPGEGENGEPGERHQQRACEHPERVPPGEPQRDQVHHEGYGQRRIRRCVQRRRHGRTGHGHRQHRTRPAPPPRGRYHRQHHEHRGGPARYVLHESRLAERDPVHHR